MLFVRGILYPSFNSTDGISVDVFFAGCFHNPHCDGCHNPMLWEQKAEDAVEVVELFQELLKYKETNRVVLLGGDALHQDWKSLVELVTLLHSEGKQVWLYTGYEISDLSDQELEPFDYIKTGRYLELESENRLHERDPIHLASANQKIWKNNHNGSFDLWNGD